MRTPPLMKRITGSARRLQILCDRDGCAGLRVVRRSTPAGPCVHPTNTSRSPRASGSPSARISMTPWTNSVCPRRAQGTVCDRAEYQGRHHHAVKEALGATSPNSTTPHASLARRGSPFTKKSSCLDARWLARKGLFPRDYSTRRYDMHVFNPIIDWLSIGPRAAQVTFVTGQIQLIPINWLPIRGV